MGFINRLLSAARVRSPWIYCANARSCNGCDIEIAACLTPRYDAEQVGVLRQGSPKHLLWAGIGAEVIGYASLFMEVFALRERVMDVLEAISGNRVHYGMNCIGGVNRDLPDPEMILAAVRDVRRALERAVVPVFTSDRTVRARAVGVGVLSREDALYYGTVGPTARASGIATDVRHDRP